MTSSKSESADERRFRLVVEGAPNAIVMIDRTGKIVIINAQAERVFDYSRAELVGQPIEILVPERFRSHHPEWRQAFFADAQSRPMGAGRDLYGLKKDGSEFPIEIGLNPIEIDEGIMVLSTIIDITARKAAERALRESEQRYSLLVDGITDYAIYMLDPNGIVINWNRGAQRIKGYSTEEIIGQQFSRFYTEEDRAANLPRQSLEIAVRDGRYEAEAWRVRKDGSRFLANVVIDALKNEDGQLIGFAKITRDVSERVQAARELEEARARLAQSRAEEALHRARAELAHLGRLSMLGELATSIAHEVIQPMTAIGAAAETGLGWLERTDPNVAEARKLMRRIVGDARRVSDIVGRTRAMALGRAPQQAELSLREVIEESMLLVRHELETQGVVISLDLTPALPQITGDRTQLQQVVVNLIINAVQAMANAGAVRKLFIGAKLMDTETICCTFEDSGPGIDPLHLDRLFDSFFTTKPGGMGMGLRISRSIIEAHGGHIQVDNRSALGGARFSILLPTRAAASGAA